MNTYQQARHRHNIRMVCVELRNLGFSCDLDQRLTREWLYLARAAAGRDDRASLRYCLDNARLYYDRALQSGAY